jgi:hypothetical protein
LLACRFPAMALGVGTGNGPINALGEREAMKEKRPAETNPERCSGPLVETLERGDG